MSEIHAGWTVTFRKNIHMYTHRLLMAKRGREYDIPCEDSPLSTGLVAMWPYELKIEDQVYEDLLDGLRTWASHSGLKYRIYKTRNEYETNVSNSVKTPEAFQG